MLIAALKDTLTGEVEYIWREKGATAPCYISGIEWTKLAYWENRLEIFDWAHFALYEGEKWQVWNTLYIDGFTGEVLDYDALLDEYFEMCEMLDNQE